MLYEVITAGAIHAILAPLNADEQRRAWDAVEEELRPLEGPDGFVSPGEVLVGAGVNRITSYNVCYTKLLR